MECPFPKKRIHEATWRSPDGVTCNKIDHILIIARHKPNLISNRTYRGANVDSDHYLVIARIRARISVVEIHRAGRSKRWLKDRESYQAFQSRTDELIREGLGLAEVENIQDVWDGVEKELGSAAEQILGTQEPLERSGWFD